MRIASAYIPNGREVDHDHYKYKLEWLGRLHDHLDKNHKPADDVVVVGDYNIAPEDAAPHVVLTSRTTAVGQELAIEAADEAQLDMLEDEDEATEYDGYDSEVIERYQSINDESDSNERGN